MIKTEIVHTNDNGDIEYKVLNDIDCFIKGMGWCIVLLLASFFCLLIKKWVVFPFLSEISGIFALCFIVLFGILYRRSYLLGREEASSVADAINDIVMQDAIQRNQEVAKVKFCSDTLDSYGSIDKEYVLALLSDKTVLKYPIEQLNCEDKRYNHKLIKKECSVCTNKTLTKKILKIGVLSKIMRSPILVKLIIWIIIIGILAIGAIAMFLFLKNIHDAYDFMLATFIILGLLAFIPLNSYVDKILPKNRIYNVIRIILEIPIFMLYLSELVIPFMTIVITILLMFAYSFLPVFFVVKGVELLGHSLTLNVKLFIFLTFPLLIASQGSKLIRNIILKKTPFSENDHHYQLLIRELVKFLYTKENLNFIIYAGYFVFLTVSTFKVLQTGDSLLSRDIDLIVMKSFIVYMACTSMFDRKKSSNIEGNALLNLFLKILFVSDDETWRQKRKSHQLDD
ncbi:MAG: hypothetical protein KBH27_07585 [Prevotella sp.]|nr:hypothetical protein [Prevotella sp.]